MEHVDSLYALWVNVGGVAINGRNCNSWAAKQWLFFWLGCDVSLYHDLFRVW